MRNATSRSEATSVYIGHFGLLFAPNEAIEILEQPVNDQFA
jgi:hypothetical protein